MFIGIDIGGTNIKGVLTDSHGNICGHSARPTGKSVPEIDNNICDLIESLSATKGCGNRPVQAIGIGSAGSIDREKGIVVTSPNIRAWNRYPLASRIEERTGIRVFLENDATVAVIGESWMGHGRKFRNWIMLTLGTGIGGGAVLDGHLYTGQSGSSMEVGHTSIDYRGRRCSCGNRGCLELYASASSVVRYARAYLRKKVPSSLGARNLAGPLTARTVYEEALKGDALALRVLRETAAFLGIGIANLVNLFNPEAVILGGGLSRAHRFILPVVRAVVRERALAGMKENIRYLIIRDQAKAPALGAAKVAMDSLGCAR